MGDLNFLDFHFSKPLCNLVFASFRKLTRFGQGSPKVSRMGDLDFLDFRKLVHDTTFFEAFTPDVMVDVMVLPRTLFRKLWAGSPKVWGTRMGDLDVLDLIKEPSMTKKFEFPGPTFFEASMVSE